jgi:transcriptional regulator with XRE-family HTH domain
MVAEHQFPKHTRTGAALFPAYGTVTPQAACSGVEFVNPFRDTPTSSTGQLDTFTIVVLRHSSFDAEWPIQINVPLALKGFRHTLGLSQVKFAKALGVGRLNIERWETGKNRPFGGHVLSLLTLLRPLVDCPLAAGQLLNLAAAVVCPHLTRPAAIYTQREIEIPLAEKRGEHLDLAPALVEALVHSEILVPVDPSEEGPEARYIPLVGIGAIDRKIEPWEPELRVIAHQLKPDDRKLWLTVGKRLASGSAK